METVKTAKAIPAIYVSAYNTRLALHEDTAYLEQHRFTGHIYGLYANGDTEFIKSYFDGLEEGLQKKWYPDRNLAEQRFYINGKKEGLQQTWWPDGKQRFVYTALADAYNGELKEWNRAGMLYRDFNYVNGQEEGSEKMWWANGSVRANYVIRDGKRYGLLGMKVCENPYDSVRKSK